MGLLKLFLGLAVLAALAAFFTRPGPEDVDPALRRALYERLFTEEADIGRDMLGSAAVLGCRLDPQACFEILRTGLDIRYEDRFLYATVEVEGFGRRARCWGAFTRFHCPRGFERMPQG